MNGRRLVGGAGLLALAMAGCFDVHAIDPGPLPFVLDDFNDGDVQPTDPNFGEWECYTTNPMGPPNTCTPMLLVDGSPALALDATIVDPPDNIQQHGGATLGTFAPLPEDFTRYSVVEFRAKLESGSPPIPINAVLYVEIGCRTVAGQDGVVPSRVYVSASFETGSTWKYPRLSLRNFGWPSYVPAQNDAGPIPCLQKADSVRFSVDAALPDATTGVFQLAIDDVTFQ